MSVGQKVMRCVQNFVQNVEAEAVLRLDINIDYPFNGCMKCFLVEYGVILL